MKTTKKHAASPFLLVGCIIGFLFNATAQDPYKTDSVIRQILHTSSVTGDNDQGIQLVKDEKYVEANQFFSNEIAKNELNREAYFKRGAVNWQLNDAAAACRDWSAVLALGDTATFLLLDGKCHGTMILGGDTVHSKRYHQMWANTNKDTKSMSDNAYANTVVDEMPEFPGGQSALIDYLAKNIHYPAKARERKLQGRVYVNFIINSKGKVIFPYTMRGVDKSLDAEAVRVIREMPVWKPGKLKGKPVLVRHTIPVKFVLN